MNDFDDETDAATIAADSALRCGLLPREHVNRGATFVRRPSDEREPTKMYRALAVRVEDESATLLVGPQSDVDASQTYRLVDVGGVSSGRLKTVRFRPTERGP